MNRTLKIITFFIICILALIKVYEILSSYIVTPQNNIHVLENNSPLEAATKVADSFILGIPYTNIEDIPNIAEENDIYEYELENFIRGDYLRPEYILQTDVAVKEAKVSEYTGEPCNEVFFYYKANIPIDSENSLNISGQGLMFRVVVSNRYSDNYEITNITCTYTSWQELTYDPMNKKMKIFGDQSVFKDTGDFNKKIEDNQDQSVVWNTESNVLDLKDLPNVYFDKEYYANTNTSRYICGDFELHFIPSSYYTIEGTGIISTMEMVFVNNSRYTVIPGDIFILTAEQNDTLLEWQYDLSINTTDKGFLDFKSSYYRFYNEGVKGGESQKYIVGWCYLDFNKKIELYLEANNGKNNKIAAGKLGVN